MSRAAAGLLILAAVLLALSFAAGRATDGATGATVAAAPDPAATGRQLFQAKGCTSCHRHDGLQVARVTFGDNDKAGGTALVDSIGAPDLTGYRADTDFLRVWLKDPQAVRPETIMPDLGLKEVEIEALIAFLAADD